MFDGSYQLENSPSRTNQTSTGAISTNIFDMEQDGSSNVILTDDQGIGYLNIVITSVSYTSGGTEGITIQVRTDDATDLATAKNGTSAGYIVLGAIEIPLEEIVAGAKFSVPFIRGKLKRYLGAWVKATSTTYTGTFKVDMWISNLPTTENDSLQKVPA